MLDTMFLKATEDMIESMPIWPTLFLNRYRLREKKRFRTLVVKRAGKGGIIVGISIPQLLWGSSVHEYIPRDSEMLRSEMKGIFKGLGVGVKDIRKLEVVRLDLCRNIVTRHTAADHVIQAARYRPRRAKTAHFNTETAHVWWNKNRRIVVYDKVKQARIKKPRNLTRVELQLRNVNEVRECASVFSFDDVLSMDWKRANSILHANLALVVDVPPFPPAPDASAIWEMAQKVRKRDTAPYFMALYLASRMNLDPEDVDAMNEQLRQHYPPRACSRLRRGILSPLAVARMDDVFRKEVLDRILDPPPEVA
mgnify:CR=1 FL=1